MSVETGGRHLGREEDGLGSAGKCCFTVYSIFTFICSLIVATGRCHYPDFTDVETVAHKGLVTCPESPNEFRAEPDSNPALSTMPPVV